MHHPIRLGRFLVLVTTVLVLTGTLPVASAQAQAEQDYAVAWSGAVAARSLAVPGLSGGFISYVIASFRLRIPSGGTWHVESAVTATGVRKATAPGSTFGRASFGHTLECGPDQRDAAGWLTTRAAFSVTGRNLLYDESRTTTARTLWPTVRGYNRCQVIITVGRDDLAIAGKQITINSGYIRLIGRGLDDPRSVAAYGHPQTAILQMPSPRFLRPNAPTITSPNFEIAGYVAPTTIAVAGNAAVTTNVTHLDAIADAYITTCYSTTAWLVGPFSHLPPCPSTNGTVLTGATYQSLVIVQQYDADGTVCRQTASPTLTQRTTGVVHHQETRNRVSVAIDPACTSRTFRVKLFVRWVSGNTFYVESSHLTHISIRSTSS